eukprot:821824_1
MHITATDYNKFSTQIQKQRDTTLPASTIDYDHDNSHWIPYVISNQMKFIFTYDHDKDNNTIIESFTRKYGRHHEHATATNESSDAASCDQEPPLKRRRTCKRNDQDDNDNKRRTPSKLNIKCTNGSDCLDFIDGHCDYRHTHKEIIAMLKKRGMESEHRDNNDDHVDEQHTSKQSSTTPSSSFPRYDPSQNMNNNESLNQIELSRTLAIGSLDPKGSYTDDERRVIMSRISTAYNAHKAILETKTKSNRSPRKGTK